MPSQLRKHMLVGLLAAVAAAPNVNGYIWPNPRLDDLESLRWDQFGARHTFIGGFVTPCNQFIGKNGQFEDIQYGGRTDAADWLRTAYHDVATHDAQAGTGGMDASIRFSAEQERPENVGDAFTNTLSVVGGDTTRYISFADVIAAAAIYAVEACGGPKIDFRGGRVDATEAGPAGVPEPQDTLQSHTAAFARMGFTPTEMIQLVACGHSLGGVQNAAFPTIVPGSTATSDNPDGQAAFDSSVTTYDNRIATDYISGRTNNPLVVGANITTRSDARIFSSDGNATMKAFASSPELYHSTCATMLARLLNTVPRDVQLTEVIEPLPVKPVGLSLTLLSNGSFLFKGGARFWNLDAEADASIRLRWAERTGHPCAGCSAPLSPASDGDSWGNVGKSYAGNHSALWYDFPDEGVLISKAGVSRFWFEVTEHGRTWIEDQAGLGFPLQTDVVTLDTTCTNSDDTTTVNIAVRKGLHPSLVYVLTEVFDGDTGDLVPATLASYAASLGPAQNSSAYDVYAVVVPTISTFNVGATVGGRNVTEWTTSGQLFGRTPRCS